MAGCTCTLAPGAIGRTTAPGSTAPGATMPALARALHGRAATGTPTRGVIATRGSRGGPRARAETATPAAGPTTVGPAFTRTCTPLMATTRGLVTDAARAQTCGTTV